MDKLKERLFALYWGQTVLYNNYGGAFVVDGDTINYVGHEAMYHYLQLRSIESLTDEEYIEVLEAIEERSFIDKILVKYTKVEWGRSYLDKFVKNQLNGNMSVRITDYLRSISIALPFMGISVEEQIKQQWIKIT